MLRLIRQRESKKAKKGIVRNEKKRKESIKKKASATATLEEGEIISDDDATEESIKTKTSNGSQLDIHNMDGDDDDCVCIEPEIELITICDETDPAPDSESLSNARSTTNVKSYLTSTPLDKLKVATSQATSFPEVDRKYKQGVGNDDATTDAAAADPPVSPRNYSYHNWLETIMSSDDFSEYTQVPASKRNPFGPRRSQRLENKNKNNSSNYDSDDLIVLDETLIDSNMRTAIKLTTPSRKNSSSETDNSVIFVSESSGTDTGPVRNPHACVSTSDDCPEFIPLQSDDVSNPLKIVRNPLTPKRKDTSLFTTSEKKQLTKYNENAYNPVSNKEKLGAGKRMVIVDGSNVAFSHSLNKEFSVKGLKICLEYFQKMGHEVKAVVPQFRHSKYKSSDPDELNALHSAGKIVFTPCKNLPSARSISYDDRFILQLACELDAAIVSNDNYRDLIHENAAFKKIIENRVTGYTWCNDIFILPKDPYGKWGPPLHKILNRT